MTTRPSALSRIKAALELASKATPGPFDLFFEEPHWMVSTLSIPQHPIALHGPNKVNAELHAALRNCVPDIRALVEACEGMAEALETAAKQFDFYAGQHDQKADAYEAALDPNRMLIDDTRNKAEVNRKCAAACRAALTTQDGER